MSSYTITLKRVAELYTKQEVINWFQDYEISDFLTQEQITQLNTWGLFDKAKLANKIVDYYWLREIGYETPTLFKQKAQLTMEGLMEEYLPLFYSASLTYDPLINENYTETFTRNIDGTAQNNGSSNSNSSSNSESLGIINNTPQTNITKQNLESGFYASQVNQSESTSSIEDTTTTSNQGTSNTQETYTRTTKGNRGVLVTAQKLVEQYRSLIRPLETEIIEKLSPLFFGLY